MATLQECVLALQGLAERLAAIDPDVRARHVVQRTLACRVPDLDVVFLATLDDDGISRLRCRDGADTEGAQVRLVADSDDLVALVEGELSAPAAWATGRLKVQASPLDLLKLRALL
ncbi:MAG: SCP2 sterol-binding domain-containing protein [Mycobacteriales bacterium]